MSDDKTRELAFLKAYKALCLAHGFELRGCGDCGSAWLEVLSEEQLRNGKLSWDGNFREVNFADDYDMRDGSRTKDDFTDVTKPE